MAVKLHRCPSTWAKLGGHPCWKVQKALDEQGIEYETVKGPWPGRKNRTAVGGMVAAAHSASQCMTGPLVTALIEVHRCQAATVNENAANEV